MNVNHDSVWGMINVAWSYLEVNVINNGIYVKDLLTYPYTHNEWMKLMNENKGF